MSIKSNFIYNEKEVAKNKDIHTILDFLKNTEFNFEIVCSFTHSTFYRLKDKNDNKLVVFTVFNRSVFFKAPIAVSFLCEFDFQPNDEYSTSFNEIDNLIPELSLFLEKKSTKKLEPVAHL